MSVPLSNTTPGGPGGARTDAAGRPDVPLSDILSDILCYPASKTDSPLLRKGLFIHPDKLALAQALEEGDACDASESEAYRKRWEGGLGRCRLY